MISDNSDGRWGYRAGPSDAMKREIGQIVTNHAGCDPALYALFHALSGVSTDQAKVISRTLKLRSNSLLSLIKAFRKENESKLYPPLAERIDVAISHYDKLTSLRNVVAHWQWSLSPEGEDSAIASNFLSLKARDSNNEREINLRSLQEISLGLIEVMSLMHSIAALMDANPPTFVIDKALEALDDIFKKVRDTLLGLPDVSDDSQP
ncbi:hypothetical protein B7H19_09965 [Pseudomonas putida]|uniref:hypothetical protein n=1 Tax=Pseudomonas putida TaxID=303 RepID=UPI000A111F23|nr:hypothetical protein [Pseudomonas putida]ORL69251.1 hypothetical protein B7H19_09965 [Pseudomonas putida]